MISQTAQSKKSWVSFFGRLCMLHYAQVYAAIFKQWM